MDSSNYQVQPVKITNKLPIQIDLNPFLKGNYPIKNEILQF